VDSKLIFAKKTEASLISAKEQTYPGSNEIGRRYATTDRTEPTHIFFFSFLSSSSYRLNYHKAPQPARSMPIRNFF
jgi:hypothetical protein